MFYFEEKSNLKEIMRDCLTIKGHRVTEGKLNELFRIYEDCQLWDGDIMLTGDSYDEVEDFVKHSCCVLEVFA